MAANKERLNTAKPGQKIKLSNENLPHFQWELTTLQPCGETLLKDYPMSGPRNGTVGNSRLKALNCILANQRNGRELIIPNFANVNKEATGFSRAVFLTVLEHLMKVALVGREGEGFTRSILTFSTRIRRYEPGELVSINHHRCPGWEGNKA